MSFVSHTNAGTMPTTIPHPIATAASLCIRPGVIGTELPEKTRNAALNVKKTTIGAPNIIVRTANFLAYFQNFPPAVSLTPHPPISYLRSKPYDTCCVQ